MTKTVIILIILDVITGVCNACAKHQFKSSKMRSGGFKKFAELSIVLGSRYIKTIYPDAAQYVDIVFYYLIVMNGASIAENFSKLYPNNPLSKKFIKIFESEDKEQ